VDLLPVPHAHTTNPPGNETVGARFLADVLERDGIATETVESAPGRGNLVARLRGDRSEGGIVLHHHIDVVYADRRYWTVDPFGGEIRDGFLYGRGAIDMKSTGVLHLAGVLAIRRAKVPLKRDLILLATADEEAGSRFGAQFVADRHRDWLAGAEYALSELGGIYPEAGATAPFGSIVTSEKTGLPLRLTARSEPGHGSMPWPDTAPNWLVRALGRLLEAERPLRVLPVQSPPSSARCCRARRGAGTMSSSARCATRDSGARSWPSACTPPCCGRRLRSRCSRGARSAT
jgi:acetylornithine deacetylase/succinyl-diaminopimelate desuccinylase-like protein